MKFNHLISTIFLGTTFACIFLFAGIFGFYLSADSKTLILLKDSLSTASSFFGGITTLVAAYIASKLFNDWKVQHNKTVEKEIAWDVVLKFDEADLHLSEFHEDFRSYLSKNASLEDLSDEEFENLDSDLQNILASLKGANFKFSSFLEALRKYSIVANKTYHDDYKKVIMELHSLLRYLKNLRATYPGSIDHINNQIGKLLPYILLIEQEIIDNILRELKAHK